MAATRRCVASVEYANKESHSQTERHAEFQYHRLQCCVYAASTLTNRHEGVAVTEASCKYVRRTNGQSILSARGLHIPRYAVQPRICTKSSCMRRCCKKPSSARLIELETSAALLSNTHARERPRVPVIATRKLNFEWAYVTNEAPFFFFFNGDDVARIFSICMLYCIRTGPDGALLLGPPFSRRRPSGSLRQEKRKPRFRCAP